MIVTPALEVMLIIFLVTAVISDFSDHRIPNAITLFAAVVGLSSHLYLGGLQGVGLSLGGLVLGMGCLLPFYLRGGMGAGDVKMMGAIGAFVGPEASLFAVAVGLVAGGLGGLGLLLFNAISGQRPRRDDAAGTQRAGLVTAGDGVFHAVAARQTLKARFPYALALAAGAVAALIYLRG
jgi:prepilin peptidase CpaA